MNQEPILVEAPTTALSPRPFGEIPGLWLKLFTMDSAFFAAELPRASNKNTLLSVLILALIATVLSGVTSFLRFIADVETTLPGIVGGLTCASCVGIVGNVASFYVGNGLAWLGARLFGGQGSFGKQAYLFSLVSVPTTVISNLIFLALSPLGIPFVSSAAVLMFGIYTTVLTVRAVKVTHDLSTGEAVGAVLIPSIVLGILFGCLVTGVLLVAGPAISEFLETAGNLPY